MLFNGQWTAEGGSLACVDRGERGALLMGRQQEIQGRLMTGLWVDNGGCRGVLSSSEEWAARGRPSTDNGECGYSRVGVGSCCWLGSCGGCGRSRWMEGGGGLLKGGGVYNC